MVRVKKMVLRARVLVPWRDGQGEALVERSAVEAE